MNSSTANAIGPITATVALGIGVVLILGYWPNVTSHAPIGFLRSPSANPPPVPIKTSRWEFLEAWRTSPKAKLSVQHNVFTLTGVGAVVSIPIEVMPAGTYGFKVEIKGERSTDRGTTVILLGAITLPSFGTIDLNQHRYSLILRLDASIRDNWQTLQARWTVPPLMKYLAVYIAKETPQLNALHFKNIVVK